MTAKWCFLPTSQLYLVGLPPNHPSLIKTAPVPSQGRQQYRVVGQQQQALTSKGLRPIVCWSPACCVACNAQYNNQRRSRITMRVALSAHIRLRLQARQNTSEEENPWASVPRVGCHALVCRRLAGIFGRTDHGHQAHMRRVHQLRGQVQGGGSSPFPATLHD